VQQQVLMWDSFAQAWDGIIDDQRAADKLSNREVGSLWPVEVSCALKDNVNIKVLNVRNLGGSS
jgi:hypothetical protein